jgi:hypothetical protein
VTPLRPYRGSGAGRPGGIPLPPGRMPPWHGGRMLKRWRYVGLYTPAVMLCAGDARVGPTRQVWWAVWDREAGRLHERTRALAGRGRVAIDPGRLRVQDDDVRIDLALEEQPGVEVVTPDGRTFIWTRKQGGVPAHGAVEAGGRRFEVDDRAFVDESAGYHRRVTSWLWSAGVGRTADGSEVAWNLVEGIHDSPKDSERTVWVQGRPHEVGPVRFASDLSAIDFAEGGSLTFASESVRRRDDNLLVFRSRYEQPFGSFGGVLPGAGALAEGYGVMERHDVRW